jgi:ornithine cyclodeaminase/alanine dehydrogenase-like protein (mu-crystallin family)
VITVPSPGFDPSLLPIKPTGSLTLYAPDGSPVGFLHAQTLTAFRTALASSCLLMKRATVKTLTVFGAGIQAYWHIRLALMLRGRSIKTVNIINREFSNNVKEIMRQFYQVPRKIKEREGWEQAEFSILTPGYGEYERLQREHILAADVIYCCTPSTEELFDGGILTSYEGRHKGRLIVAIGSYTKDMRELPKDLLVQAIKPHEHGRFHFHKHATEGGVIVVDTLRGALREAGEIIDAGLEPKQLVEYVAIFPTLRPSLPPEAPFTSNRCTSVYRV